MQCGTARGAFGKDLNDDSFDNIGSDEAGIEWERNSRIYVAFLAAGQIEKLSDLALTRCGRDEEGEVEEIVHAR